jgi:hypothetical protein
MFGPFKFKKTSSILIINGNNDILKIIDDVAFTGQKKKKKSLIFDKANIQRLIVQIESQ